MTGTGGTTGFSPGFGWRTIGASKPNFNTSRFMATVTHELTRIMREEGREVKKELEGVTKSWETPVTFNMDINVHGDSFYLSVWTDNEIFRFVNDGTSIRYATMTPDFIPKTTPGRLFSTPGRGGRAYINRKIPRAGIAARNFVDTAYKRIFRFAMFRLEDKFDEIVNRFWDEALRE